MLQHLRAHSAIWWNFASWMLQVRLHSRLLNPMLLAKCIPCMHRFVGYFSADNNFGPTGAVAIANALKGVTNLRGLHLAGV